MKTATPVLYPNEKVGQRVIDYSDDKSTALPKSITEYHAFVCETESANYSISTFQAKSHIWLARVISAKRVLEIGVYIGFSSLVWAHAVGPDGKVTGLEFSEDYAERARKAYEKYGSNNAEVVVGDALETLASLDTTEPYDLIFIDAQKSGYPQYLETILARSQPGQAKRLLRAGGLIVADNVLRRGLVADASDDNPWVEREKKMRSHYWQPDDMKAIDTFNTELATNPRIEAFLAPLFDGMGLGRLVD